MEEGFYSAAFYLHQSVLSFFGFRLGFVFAVGAVPVALAAVALFFQLSPRAIIGISAASVAFPFALRWTLFAEYPDGTTPPFMNLGFHLGWSLGIAFLGLIVCLMIAGRRRARIMISVRSFPSILGFVAIVVVAGGVGTLIGGVWLTASLSDAVAGSAQWFGHLAGFAIFLFLANLLPAAFAGTVPTDWARGRPYALAVVVVVLGAIWFVYQSYINFGVGLEQFMRSLFS